MEPASPIPLLNFAHFAKYLDAPSNQQDSQNYLRDARRAPWPIDHHLVEDTQGHAVNARMALDLPTAAI